MTNPFTYTETELERDARLLTALGWTRLARVNLMQWYGLPPGATVNFPQACPRFHSDHNAKHTLLVWIRARGKSMMLWFLSSLHGQLSETLQFKDRPEYMMVEMMCADPAAVCIAADETLRESGYYKEMGSNG